MGPLKQLALLAIVATFATLAYAENRDGKSIGIFNVVKFNNDVCNADNQQMNGTCYTAEECASRDGVASGSCAEGYGVCCIITVSCGGSTSENCTYLSQAASTTPNTDSDDLNQQCSYSICPRTSTVNRIRLDLMMFMIAPPYAATLDGNAGGAENANRALGQCTGDTFQAGNSPVICGANDGQHMIVDSDGSSCVTALFTFGGGTVNRRYTIHVIQYESTNEMGGPPGCLQFFTGATGMVQTFNWQTATTSVHLASQSYDVCVRKMIGACVICWAPETTGTQAASGSFGVSNGESTNDAAGAAGDGAKSATGAGCGDDGGVNDSSDFIIIPSGVKNGPTVANENVVPGGILNTATVAAGAIGFDKFCGRYLAATDGVVANSAEADETVCSRVTPFKLGVRFDNYEATGAAGDAVEAGKQASQEASGATANEPLGTTGFSLGFRQFTC